MKTDTNQGRGEKWHSGAKNLNTFLNKKSSHLFPKKMTKAIFNIIFF